MGNTRRPQLQSLVRAPQAATMYDPWALSDHGAQVRSIGGWFLLRGNARENQQQLYWPEFSRFQIKSGVVTPASMLTPSDLAWKLSGEEQRADSICHASVLPIGGGGRDLYKRLRSLRGRGRGTGGSRGRGWGRGGGGVGVEVRGGGRNAGEDGRWRWR